MCIVFLSCRCACQGYTINIRDNIKLGTEFTLKNVKIRLKKGSKSGELYLKTPPPPPIFGSGAGFLPSKILAKKSKKTFPTPKIISLFTKLVSENNEETPTDMKIYFKNGYFEPYCTCFPRKALVPRDTPFQKNSAKIFRSEILLGQIVPIYAKRGLILPPQ